MLTRRTFIAGAAAAPLFVSSVARGRTGPNDKVRFGVVGCGGQGNYDMGNFLRFDDCIVTALCDIDEKKIGGLKGKAEKKHKDIAVYKDFRKLCASKDVDAVLVATPDHWHALIALEAMRNGKDVYCQKPVVHLFGEGRIVCDTAAKEKRIWQTGSQQRSGGNFRHAVEVVHNELIGKLQRVEVGLPRGRLGAGRGDQYKPSEPPAHLDYDLWCGPAPKLPYIQGRLHFHWRWCLAYGGGQLMDWIGHHNDIAHWGMGADETGPIEVSARGFKYPKDKEVFDAPYEYEVLCTYAGGVETSIRHSDEERPMGTKWIGEKGWIWVKRGQSKASNPEWIKKGFKPGEKKAYHSTNHYRNFADCVKSRKATICPAETSFRSITPGFLGYVADATGRKLKWDPKTETIVGDEEADKLLKKVEYRKPWTLS